MAGAGRPALGAAYRAKKDLAALGQTAAWHRLDLEHAPIYVLVDYRYRQRLPVLASSNCRKEALAQRLDRRVMDRLRETCAMIEVAGPNQWDRVGQRREPQ